MFVNQYVYHIIQLHIHLQIQRYLKNSYLSQSVTILNENSWLTFAIKFGGFYLIAMTLSCLNKLDFHRKILQDWTMTTFLHVQEFFIGKITLKIMLKKKIHYDSICEGKYAEESTRHYDSKTIANLDKDLSLLNHNAAA